MRVRVCHSVCKTWGRSSHFRNGFCNLSSASALPQTFALAGWVRTFGYSVTMISIISKALAGESSSSMDQLQKPADLDMDVPMVCGWFAAPCFWIPMVIGAGAMGWVGLYG